MSARADASVQSLHPFIGAAAPTAQAFRAAMRHLPGGVSVITAGSGADRTGMTATSVTSLSIEPPTVLVCIDRQLSTWPVLQAHGHFGVNILAAEHRDVAERFAGRGGVKGAARYDGARWWTLATGAPLLESANVALDCAVEELIERHSHGIVIGRVRGVRTRESASALVYWRGAYDQLGWTLDEIECAIGLRPW